MALKTITPLAIILFLQVLTTIAEDVSSEVIGVPGGDTLEVLHNQQPERIRLNGTDCPEKGQVYGNKPSRLRQP